jgi:uncharacterized repeat protein (TIGR01451 family)
VRSARRWIAAMAAVLAAAVAAVPAQADREFAPRFAANDTGNVLVAANTVLSCPANLAGCPDARAGARGAKLGNNSWDMVRVDVDADPSTFTSSTAQLRLPPGATVLFAGLYWGANTTGPTRADAALNPAARDRVLFRTPGGGYQAVTAAQVDEGDARSQVGAYQAFADVTASVAAGGAGSYTTANVQSATGVDRYAGWALVVAYSDAAEPARNMTIFDGFVSVNAGDAPRQLSVTGFRTPGFGPVRSQVGFVAYEGDLSAGGDGATLNSRPLLDERPTAPTAQPNFFNSTIGAFGLPIPDKTPDFANQLGYDADVVDATGAVPNGARSAAIQLQTTGDTYLPGVVFLATELFAPTLQSAKSVTDLNGGLVEPGDELEYRITGTNTGQDAAVGVAVTDPVPAGTDYVAGSAAGGVSQFVPGAGQLTFRVGAGATEVAGGRLAPGESYSVSYRARVAAGTPSGTVVANQARVQLIAETLGFPVDAVTNQTRLVVAAPDLAIGKAFAGTVAVGQTVTYTLSVGNTGDAPSRGEVVVEDPMPPDINFGPPGGPGWSCVQDPSFEVTCRRSDSLAPGASWPPITISGTVLAVPPGGFVNTSTLVGGGDVNASNNSATAAPPNAPLASLALDKQVTPDTAAPGDEVTYLLTVRNAGGFGPATGVQLTDALPPGLELRSAEALDQGSCAGAVTCSLGSIAGGGVARVRIRAVVTGAAMAGELTNTASATSAEPDVHLEDNQATKTVTIRNTADVSVSKRRVGTPTQGGAARWILGVVNNGPGPMPGGSLVDLVPSAVGGPTATVPGGSCTAAGQVVGCSLPPLAPGASTDVEVTGTLGANAGGEPLANGFQVTPEAFMQEAPPSDATPPSDVALPAADLGVAKVATPAPASRRGRLAWHVRAVNNGPSDATKAVVRDRLPAGARYAGSVPAGLCEARGRRVTCRLGTLRAGRAREFDIRVRLRAGRAARALTNRISGAAAQPDQAAANDRARASALLAPRLVVGKLVSRRRAGVGETLSYRLRVTNPGPGAATGVVLCDRPGRGLALRRAPDGRRSGRGACWRIGRLAQGRTATRRAIASVMKGPAASRVNRATVRTGGTRVAAAGVAVRVRRAPAGACPAAAPFGRTGPLAGPAC